VNGQVGAVGGDDISVSGSTGCMSSFRNLIRTNAVALVITLAVNSILRLPAHHATVNDESRWGTSAPTGGSNINIASGRRFNSLCDFFE
jgi:hypothetical protein